MYSRFSWSSSSASNSSSSSRWLMRQCTASVSAWPGAPRRAAAAPDRPGPGTTRSGVELRERLEREGALVETRMGHGEPRLVDDGVAVEQQVEVDRPRPPALAARSRPSRARRRGAPRAARAAPGPSRPRPPPFRNGGCSTGPHGSVSRSARDGDDVDLRLGRAARRRARSSPRGRRGSTRAR